MVVQIEIYNAWYQKSQSIHWAWHSTAKPIHSKDKLVLMSLQLCTGKSCTAGLVASSGQLRTLPTYYSLEDSVGNLSRAWYQNIQSIHCRGQAPQNPIQLKDKLVLMSLKLYMQCTEKSCVAGLAAFCGLLRMLTAYYIARGQCWKSVLRSREKMNGCETCGVLAAARPPVRTGSTPPIYLPAGESKNCTHMLRLMFGPRGIR